VTALPEFCGAFACVKASFERQSWCSDVESAEMSSADIGNFISGTSLFEYGNPA
jgi:hypothetical protein